MSRETPTDLDAALATMSADGLRTLVHELLRELDARTYARVTGSLIARAARTGSGWAPAAVSEEQVAEVLAFVRAANRAGQADPSEVDEYLRLGSAAFLRKDYPAAPRILGAILPPIGDGEIDLGQRELVDDVLGADVGECAAQYVVSAYRVAPVAGRAEAVHTAIEAVRGVGRFREPLREMERVAVEALPDLTDFLPVWRALIASKPAGRAPATRTQKKTAGCARSCNASKARRGSRMSRVRRGGLTTFERGARAWSMQANGRLR
jgi:hypothetical protein